MQQQLAVNYLGLRDYATVHSEMSLFTDRRDAATADEIWTLEHPPVFTLGQAADQAHVLDPGNIAVVKSDRGGQVTYHGPGQLIMYCLIDLRRHALGVRTMVSLLEDCVIAYLQSFDIDARSRPQAPGVYVCDSKIAALGLRVRRGCSFHGLSLNVNMDLEPFSRINPCGYSGLTVTQLSSLGVERSVEQAAGELSDIFVEKLLAS